MSEITDFIKAQYDRIEKREHGRYVVRYPLKALCPVCSDRPEGFESGRVGVDEIRLDPCGHAIPNDQFVELYAESNPDLFVLADIESKRRILNKVVDEATSLDMSVDNDRRVGPRDEVAGPYLGDKLLRLLAAPFSAEPGYDDRWAA
jgi:hypothetical protein